MTRQGVTAQTLLGLAEPTPREEIKQRPGPNNRMLDYVDARFVMDRLDAIIGAESWQDQYVDRPDGSVRCGLSILVDGEWVTKWDIGDPSDMEAVKGSYSDAFKRAAVKWGIARDLYGHAGSPQRPAPSRVESKPNSAPATAPGPSVPEEPDYVREADAIFGDVRTQARDEAATRDGFCPDHGLAWSLRPGGVSKSTGKPYDAFWACPSQDRPFCKQKPTARWAAMHEG